MNACGLQVSLVKVSRCYVQCFNVSPSFTREFRLQKSRGGGDFSIIFMDSAFDKEGEFGEFFIEFKENVYEYKLIEQFEAMGAGQVTVITFNRNDGNDSAASALIRIWDLARKTGYQETRGQCNVNLIFKAKQKQEQTCPKCGCRKRASADPAIEMHQFDVVKKIKSMQSLNEDEELDESESVLSNFMEFSAAVSQVLDSIQDYEKKNVCDDKKWMETVKENERFGFIYAAWNPGFPELIKVGATMRDNPFIRLKELSGTSVPEPFQLISALPSSDPFKLEKHVHQHLKSKRIRKNGVLTEFFKISREEISDVFSNLISQKHLT